ncbi:DUF692 domain-containing protein [Dokdonella sp.]|uniref:HvfB family MNIO-type RiPP peptide maturase n=1 Tax=Dokdonella sp. TaxID=2291710 RepID=UPI0025C379AC|nr:DUF692 domain-containing protein [Dokdonella sp.]
MRAGASLAGAGLGLRRGLIAALQSAPSIPVDFFELAPENWIGVGGRLGRALRAFTERHRFACHGLSLSLGGPAPLDETLLVRIRRFMDMHGIADYSEHLSWCNDGGHLYDLLPLPFTGEMVHHVAARIRRTQDILGRRIAVENSSYYAVPHAEMSEAEFINAVLAEADCELLLDVNNVYVNSINHRYDAHAFIDALPVGCTAWIHVAGHYNEASDLIVDTHGAPVIDPVWALLEHAYARFGSVPTMVERDFNLPPLDELFVEVGRIRLLQAACADGARRRHA